MADAATGGRRLNRLLHWPVIVSIALVLVGGVGFAAPYTFAKPGIDDSERQAVIHRAEEFAVTYNTYDAAKLDDYQKRVKSLLTDAYTKKFVQSTNALFPTLENAEQTSENPEVQSVALKGISEHSATALVAVDAKQTANDDDGEPSSTTRHYRWKITFKKESDEWLVNAFETVPTKDAELDESGQDEGSGPENQDPDGNDSDGDDSDGADSDEGDAQ